jgi:hypothetical protein
MLTVNNKKSKVIRLWKQPKKTLSKAKTSQVLFKDQLTKELEIPKVYNNYNYNMLSINIADQLTGLNSSRRRIRRGV